jgi:hypothetical protein
MIDSALSFIPKIRKNKDRLLCGLIIRQRVRADMPYNKESDLSLKDTVAGSFKHADRIPFGIKKDLVLKKT